jgi:PAS domain S-box-containing protein
MENTLDLKVFEAMPGITVLLSPDSPHFTIIAVTDHYLQVVDRKRKDLVGKSLLQSFPSREGDLHFSSEDVLFTSLQRVLLHKQPDDLLRHRYDIPAAGGQFTERWWNIHNQPVLNEEGEVLYILHTSVDITHIVHSDKRESEIKEIERFNDLFMQAPVAICIVQGSEHRVELANETMLQLLGRTLAMIGKPIQESLTEARQQGLIEILDFVSKTGGSHHVTGFPATLLINGERELRYFDMIFKPFYQQGGVTGVFCIAHNVTAQVQAREQIKEQEEELRLALEIADLGTFRLDLLQNKASNSTRIDEWFGYDKQGYSREEGFNAIHPEDREGVDRIILATMQDEANSFHDIIYRVVHPTTGIIRYLRSFGKTLFNNEGPYLIIGIIQDVTTQEQYRQQMEENEMELQRRVLERTLELQTLNEELRRTNANLEEFAYAASHDMKEPIRKIHFFADRLKVRLEGKMEEEDKRFFERMELASKRMATLIDDLLLYSHISRGAAVKEPVDLNNKLTLVLEDLELEIQEKGARIIVEKLPVVQGHRRQLQQLFQNLISNALKYSRSGETPQVLVKAKSIHPAESNWAFLKDADQPYYLITIQDNGIGFEPHEGERIFNVFTRLHGNTEYKGTGVGLSIARKVVENHNGYISAEGEPGKGATFYVFLPAAINS